MNNQNRTTTDDFAELLYKEGMKYNLKQDISASSAVLARAAFQQAAIAGHKKSTRALAQMIFSGSGGGSDKEQALLILWSGFLHGDHEALDELSDMLEEYSNGEIQQPLKDGAIKAANNIAQLAPLLDRIRHFMHELLLARNSHES